MKFKVIEDFENPLLERRQLKILVTDIKATPKRIDLVKQISAKVGLDTKTLIVDTVYNRADTNNVIVYVKAYNNEDSLKKIEVKNNIEKWKKIMDILYPKEKPKKEEKTEETKTEEKTE